WRDYGVGRLAIVTVRYEGRLVAVAPCYERAQPMRKVPGFRALRLLADAGVGSTYLDVMIDPALKQEALSRLRIGLHGLRADYWHFRPIHADALIVELCAAEGDSLQRIPGEASPTVDCN